jgi:hypothetical protein
MRAPIIEAAAAAHGSPSTKRRAADLGGEAHDRVLVALPRGNGELDVDLVDEQLLIALQLRLAQDPARPGRREGRDALAPFTQFGGQRLDIAHVRLDAVNLAA